VLSTCQFLGFRERSSIPPVAPYLGGASVGGEADVLSATGQSPASDNGWYLTKHYSFTVLVKIINSENCSSKKESEIIA